MHRDEKEMKYIPYKSDEFDEMNPTIGGPIKPPTELKVATIESEPVPIDAAMA